MKKQKKKKAIAKVSKYVDVGISKHKDKDRAIRYSDLPTDDAGWIMGKQYRPYPFDLVFLKIAGKFRPVSAWWTGAEWQGLRLKKEDKIINWKRNPEYA